MKEGSSSGPFEIEFCMLKALIWEPVLGYIGTALSSFPFVTFHYTYHWKKSLIKCRRNNPNKIYLNFF